MAVDTPWVRAMSAAPAGDTPATSAAFMVIQNNTDAEDRLVRAECDAAETVEIHESTLENDVMKMRPLTDGAPIPAGSSIELKPGGVHVMLIGLRRDLNPGDTVSITLHFANSDPVTVQAAVRQP
jgi:copper(I)-binding protein